MYQRVIQLLLFKCVIIYIININVSYADCEGWRDDNCQGASKSYFCGTQSYQDTILEAVDKPTSTLFHNKEPFDKTHDVSVPDAQYLFDFTQTDDVDDWQEQSDTVRSVGMSKAVFVIHSNTEYRRAIFFALLNPQPNGAGFAGIRSLGEYDLTGHTKLQIFCRGQGQSTGFKIVLRHKGLNDEPNYSFEQYFQAPKDEFAIRELPFSEFKAYYRGQRVSNNETLDISQITSIGIQIYGGIYLPIKQKGPATLEVNWIRAV